jgi:Fe-S-cluster-containing dehydrogenase component
MKITRRQFLKLTGLGLSGFAAKPLIESVSAAAGPTGTVTAGKRWAMVIDLKVSGGKDPWADCIAACHTIHNVPSFADAKHQVRWIWTSPYEALFADHEKRAVRGDLRGRPVLALCNHCDNPPCVPVCPTKATFKREDGIVMMDYHRCIGCRYCMAACPYGARSFNWLDPRPNIPETIVGYPTRTKGVVEKCNFCEERLAKGLQPACVEACKDRGLYFGDLNDPASKVRKLLESRYGIVRKPELGTGPGVYYLV